MSVGGSVFRQAIEDWKSDLSEFREAVAGLWNVQPPDGPALREAEFVQAFAADHQPMARCVFEELASLSSEASLFRKGPDGAAPPPAIALRGSLIRHHDIDELLDNLIDGALRRAGRRPRRFLVRPAPAPDVVEEFVIWLSANSIPVIPEESRAPGLARDSVPWRWLRRPDSH